MIMIVVVVILIISIINIIIAVVVVTMMMMMIIFIIIVIIIVVIIIFIVVVVVVVAIDVTTWLDKQRWCRALRRRHCVGGGAPVKKIGGSGAAWAVKFSNFAYLCQKFVSKELLLSRCALLKNNFLQLLGLRFEKNYKTGVQ